MKNKLQIILLTMMIVSLPSLCFSEVKTFIKEYTYQASEDDSKNSSRVTAMREVKRLLLEELGTYLESVTEVKNFQLTKDQITALTAGIVKTEIVNEKWDGHTYWIKTKIIADEGDVIKSIDNLRKDREKSRELDDLKKRSDAILEENKRLREELKLAKGEDKEKQKHNYDKSIKELSSIESVESGNRNYQNKDYKNALHDFNKAIELDPKYAYAYVKRGLLYWRLGKNSGAITDYQNALHDFDKAIELNPKDAVAYICHGWVNNDLGKYNEAFVDFNKAVEVSPKYAPAYMSRGITYGKLGKYNEAIQDYNKTIELNPKDAKAYYNRACTYSLMGNREKSIQDLTTSIKIDSKYSDMAKTDRDFDKVRNTPEFKRLMEE